MKSGIIDLSRLLSMAAKDVVGDSLNGAGTKGRKYSKVVSAICADIHDTSGLYLWGRYESNGLWRSIYLGKAGSGKTTSLRARIMEELKDERQFLWCGNHTGLSQEDVRKIWCSHYPHAESNRASINHINRSLRKIGTTHIVWVDASERSNGEIREIEADLIETMNPSANIVRSSPSGELNDFAVEVIRGFKSQIHISRVAE